MKVFLIGFMGCGKTTLGRELAECLNWQFLDLDRFIEEKYFMSIPAIFERFGENHFRKLERKALQEVRDFESVIIATGGGAPCFFDNMEIMNQSGVTFYMKLPIETLIDRLTHSRQDRPLVRNKDEEELKGYISMVLRGRELYYNQASLILNPLEYSTQELAVLLKGKE